MKKWNNKLMINYFSDANIYDIRGRTTPWSKLTDKQKSSFAHYVSLVKKSILEEIIDNIKETISITADKDDTHFDDSSSGYKNENIAMTKAKLVIEFAPMYEMCIEKIKELEKSPEKENKNIEEESR
jgi:hypothetical protein